MNRDPFDNAINNALIEIQKAYPAITNSFIFKKDGSIIANDKEFEEKTLIPILESFESLKERTKTIGVLNNFTINCKNGKLTLFNVNDRYCGLTTTAEADESQINFITHAILPPILKTLKTPVPLESPENDSIEVPPSNPQNVPTHLQSPFTKTLLVDPLSGFFDGKALQIDEETLEFWKNEKNSAKKQIEQVKIETINGNSKICKVKKIKIKNLKGKNKVRVPSKICNILNLKRGDKVNITPNI